MIPDFRKRMLADAGILSKPATLQALDSDNEYMRKIAETMMEYNSKFSGNFATGCIAEPTAPTTAAEILKSIHAAQMKLASLNIKPDKVAGAAGALFGMPIVVSPHIPTSKTVAHKRERKWCHRLRFQKERRFDITYETKEINECYVLADRVVVNQKQFDSMQKDLSALTDLMPMHMEPTHRPSFMDTFAVQSPRSLVKMIL